MAISATPIDLAFPDDADGDPLELRIALGPCRVRIGAGTGPLWATGRYEDPTGVLPLQVTQEGRRARISRSPTSAAFRWHGWSSATARAGRTWTSPAPTPVTWPPSRSPPAAWPWTCGT